MVLIFKILGLLLTWGPVVLRAVQQVETLIGNKSSKEKKKAATELIKEALAVRGIEFDENAQAMVSGLIDLLVSALNAWQGWKKEE